MTDRPSPEEVEALVAEVAKRFADVTIEPADQGNAAGIWLVIDRSTADWEVNWPGELVERVSGRDNARKVLAAYCCAPLADALTASSSQPVGGEAITGAELHEALSRENMLASLPALIMVNIEEVPGWQDSAPLVTAHCHAHVLNQDLPDAPSPSPSPRLAEGAGEEPHACEKCGKPSPNHRVCAECTPPGPGSGPPGSPRPRWG